jgi:hypothetical protein
MTLNRSSQRCTGFYSLCYICMSMMAIGSFIIISCSACLAKAFGSSVLPSCSVTLGTVTSRNGQQLLITPQQGNTPMHVKYSNATHIIQENVVKSSALRKGIYVQVLVPAGSNQAEVVILNLSNKTRRGSLLGCRMPQTPTATLGGSKSILSQGIIQQVANNTFTISPRTGRPKTFTWSTNTTFIQYADLQSSKILVPKSSVQLMGPMRNGVIMASNIAVLPQGQMQGSSQKCFVSGSLGHFVCNLAVLVILERIFFGVPIFY